MLYGAIAGTIPDLDVISGYFVDTVTALEIHRGFTHSIVFSVMAAFFFGWLISLYEKMATRKQWSWMLFWCFLTHPLLDAHTTWGTQLFWPLDIRLDFKNIFVIDPLYTLPFMVFVILAMLQKRESPKRRKWNNLGLIVSSSYMLLTLGLKAITHHKFSQALEEQNIVYEQLETKPSPFNTVLWTANVEVEDAFLIGDYSFFDTKPIQFHRHPKNHEALGSLSDDEKVQRLIAINNGWYTITENESGLYLNDLRFGLLSVNPKTEKYAFSYHLSPTSDGVIISEVPKARGDAKILLQDLWARIQGN